MQDVIALISKLNNVRLTDSLNGQILLGKDAEYDFNFHLDFDDDKVQISAVLRNNHHKIAPTYFWYMPIEFAAHDNDINKVAKYVTESIEILATCPTKIVQKNGLLFYTFTLMYFKEGAWHSPYSLSCLRYSNWIVPNSKERKVTYLGA